MKNAEKQNKTKHVSTGRNTGVFESPLTFLRCNCVFLNVISIIIHKKNVIPSLEYFVSFLFPLGRLTLQYLHKMRCINLSVFSLCN